MKNQGSIFELRMNGLPVIQSVDDFSKKIKLSKYIIYQLSANSKFHYKVYSIPKKSGGTREITQPNRKLKALQSWILVNILNKLQVSPNSKGFQKGTSTKDNAIPHVGNNALLSMDIKDFFTSITANKVFQVFRAIGYNNLMSTVLTNICTYNNYLPQGGPCSPMLANLVCWRLDTRIQNYVGKKGITYTRYADDMAFSSLLPSKLAKIRTTINIIIMSEGFEVNEGKTRVAGPSKCKKITGLVINENGVGIGKVKYKRLRTRIFLLSKVSGTPEEQEISQIQGWIAYLNSVDSKRYHRILKYIKTLNAPSSNPSLEKLIAFKKATS